jgi:hypothetical protein
MKNITTLFLLLCLGASCSKETVKTPGQVTADEINSVAKQRSITHVEIFLSGISNSGGAVTFTLEGQFLVTGGSYYNLEKL